MFFYLSKIFWTFAQPISLLLLLMIASLLAGLLRRRRSSLVLLAAGLLILGVFGWTTAGALMLKPLEQRFQRPATLPPNVAGIVVLGGAFEGRVNQVRGGYELGDAADRMTEAAMLALRYPQARLVISGGSGTILSQRAGDGETAPPFFEALGIPRARVIIDTQSRNTAENATEAKRVAAPAPGETWLLVTSAFHMPRSMALFREAGFPVTAWPVDFRTAGDESFGLCRDSELTCFKNATLALREWIGLLAYWLTGRIASPLPAP
jgi:uncharacterized SAM-binding protein YcdF (DUF218 family)